MFNQRANSEGLNYFEAWREGAAPVWSTVSYSPTNFTAGITPSELDASKLASQPNDPIQIMQILPPVSKWVTTSNSTEVLTIYDLGQNMVGWCTISLSNLTVASGTKVRVRHAEVLKLDSNNYPISNGGIERLSLQTAAQEDNYYLTSDAAQTFHPHFTYHGFRYVEIQSPPSVATNLTLDSVRGCVIHSGVASSGSFCCHGTNAINAAANWVLENGLINKLVTNAFWGGRGNLQGVFTACTQREEREGYLYDEHIFSQTACFFTDMAAFLTKWIADIRDAQTIRGDGGYTACAPWDNNTVFSNGGILYSDPGSQAGGITFPWRLYENYGDTRALAQHYQSATNWMDYLDNKCGPAATWNTHFWSTHSTYAQIGDWCNAREFFGWGAPVSHPYGWRHDIPQIQDTHWDPWGTAWSAYSADLVAAISGVLRSDALERNDASSASLYGTKQAAYLGMAADIRHASTNDLAAYYTNIQTSPQGDCLSALWFNMIPEDQRPNLVTNGKR